MKHNLYRHFGEDGVLLYVGISINSISRLAQHRDHAHWFALIKNVTIEEYDTREAALNAEREAISKENPLHNLMRPSVKKQKEAQRESGVDLIKRIVQFNPTYSVDEVAAILGAEKSKVREWISKGLLGWVKIGESRGRWGVHDKIRVTGWQLIDFIEYLEAHQQEKKK